MASRQQNAIDARFPYWRSTLVAVMGVVVMGLGVTRVDAIRDGGATTVAGYLVVVGLLQVALGLYFKRRTDRRLYQVAIPRQPL